MNLGSVAGHCFIDAVVDDLPDKMVQTLGRRRADVHARPLADGFQSVEDLNVVVAVLGLGFGIQLLAQNLIDLVVFQFVVFFDFFFFTHPAPPDISFTVPCSTWNSFG